MIFFLYFFLNIKRIKNKEEPLEKKINNSLLISKLIFIIKYNKTINYLN